jgi:hypothetical protein
MVLPGAGYSSVITPAPFNTNAAAVMGDVQVTGGPSANVTASGDGSVAATGSAVSPTASKSSAGITRAGLRLAWGILAVGVWIL